MHALAQCRRDLQERLRVRVWVRGCAGARVRTCVRASACMCVCGKSTSVFAPIHDLHAGVPTHARARARTRAHIHEHTHLDLVAVELSLRQCGPDESEIGVRVCCVCRVCRVCDYCLSGTALQIVYTRARTHTCAHTYSPLTQNNTYTNTHARTLRVSSCRFVCRLS